MQRAADPTPRRSAIRPGLGAIALVIALGAVATACASAGSGPSGGERSSPSVTQVGRSGSTTTPDDAPADDPATPELTSVVAASAHEPIDLVQRPGDAGHLWLAERAGRVRRLAIDDGGDTLSSTGDYSLEISSQTTTEAERGLLGMAFSPDGDLLYLSYTDPDGNSRVVSYEMDGAEIVTSSRTLVFAQDQPYPNHNGGHIAFGPDGKLWLGLGDGGAGDDPENRAQDPSTYLGKVVRIDPKTRDVEIVITGVRNPWRWAFDTDGSLWIGDVGQESVEEVDHLPAAQIDGANLGWSGYEGTEPHLDGDGRRPDDATPPVFQYRHADGNCSITGGFVYRGTAIPALEGAFVFADYCAGRVRAIRLGSDGKLAHEYDLGIDIENPVSFAQDQAGEPYVLSQGGTIVRLLPAD